MACRAAPRAARRAKSLVQPMMPTRFFNPISSGTSWSRAGLVFALVLLIHAWALYGLSRGLAAIDPKDATQTTLSVALLAPPPAPVAAAEPAKPRPRPRPRSSTAPSMTPVAPAPVEAAPVESPPAEPVQQPPAQPPKVADEVPVAAPAADASMLPPGAQALPTKGRIVYRTTYTRLLGI